jgi:hypothetical protein
MGRPCRRTDCCDSGKGTLSPAPIGRELLAMYWRFRIKVTTALAVGLSNIVQVAIYRVGVKLRLNKACRLSEPVVQGPFFVPVIALPMSAFPVASWQTSALLFGRWPFTVTAAPPDWVANPLSGKRIDKADRVWWQIPDFDPMVGDIKLVWELSRMDWVLAFAQRGRNGDRESLARLNLWLADWCTHNPPYRGPNWKCGQEASIRVMHLAMAALLLGQVRETTTNLRDLVRQHLQRIAPTVQYAMAQDNNHGTSEAAALFIGGSWLATLGVVEGVRWQDAGRRWLENRAARLIGSQGSFSQHSLNYHRLLLDTLSMVEVWRRHLALPTFSARWQTRALAAAEWLRYMVNPVNGDGPNVGANDGARLLQLTDTTYRDYRPSVQLAMALFASQRAYSEGSWDQVLHWLEVPLQASAAPQARNYVADDGGFAVLRRGAAMAMLRYPRFRFRPSQADALHLDLWLGEANLLRDAGSYSYNTENEWLAYFGGTASHNTVQFDDRDQMPRLSRFLFGDWLKTLFVEPLLEGPEAVCFGAAYVDCFKAGHHRCVTLSDDHIKIVDEVGGFSNKAVLRWRLMPGHWALHGCCLTNGIHQLEVRSSSAVARCEVVDGWESRHYLEKTTAPILEVEVHQPCTLTTEYRWPK